MRGKKIPKLDDRGYMAEMRDLKLAYRHTYWQLRAVLKAAGPGHPDEETIKGAISDVAYTISWLHTGRRPGNKRGVERLAAYQRERPVDPLVIQAYVVPTNSRSSSTLTEDERKQLDEALALLSLQELECFLMAEGQCIAYEEIANMLCISKSTVQTYVERARAKVAKGWQRTMF